jgi:ring-1,2-phenylacetyl-CoA epoxidase subunit PaaD
VVSVRASSEVQERQERLSRARAALDAVTDPELPFLTIRDLGVLRDVRLVDDTVEVVITPTYLGCPAWDVIARDVELALTRSDAAPFRIRANRSPAWTTDWLTAEARVKLRQHGIAPPEEGTAARTLFSAVAVQCPKCGSPSTERVSEFGSTACKAHYRCLACREPFDYFKCV